LSLEQQKIFALSRDIQEEDQGLLYTRPIMTAVKWVFFGLQTASSFLELNSRTRSVLPSL